MTKKIVFAVALALVIVGIAAPNASAACNPPKFASTYNAVTGAFVYFRTTLPTAGASVAGDMWSGVTNATGTCNPFYFGVAPGDIGLSISLGDACVPSGVCPAGTLSVMATVTSGTDSQQFVATATTETPSGGVNFDFSTQTGPLAGLGMVAAPQHVVTSSSRSGSNVNLSLSFPDISGGLRNGTAAQITGYNVCSAQTAANPGHASGSFGGCTFVAAPGGIATTASKVVDCTLTSPDRWVVTQVVTAAGPSSRVSRATRVNCNPNLADPKYKVVPKGKALGQTKN